MHGMHAPTNEKISHACSYYFMSIETTTAQKIEYLLLRCEIADGREQW